MTKHFFKIWSLSLALLFTACYTDDSSQPNPDRLPFEDFTGFFNDNNTKVDTLVFNADQNTTLTTAQGATIYIPENAFSASGEVSMEIKEAASKADFLFLNKPTLNGSTWLECSNAISIKPFNSSGTLNIDNPLNIKIPVATGTTADNMGFYHYQNDWTPDNNIDVLEDGNSISFDSDQNGWQLGAKNFDSFNNTAQLTINPVGYETVPHDMKAFIMLANQNVVLPLSEDVATVSANGMIPIGTEIHIVAMVMDHFKLSVGIETLTVNENTTMDLQMQIVSANEMVNLIKDLN